MLYLRMLFYAIFAGLAGAAIGDFDSFSGVYSISIEQVVDVVGPMVGFVVTFIFSRVAKVRGGAT